MYKLGLLSFWLVFLRPSETVCNNAKCNTCVPAEVQNCFTHYSFQWPGSPLIASWWYCLQNMQPQYFCLETSALCLARRFGTSSIFWKSYTTLCCSAHIALWSGLHHVQIMQVDIVEIYHELLFCLYRHPAVDIWPHTNPWSLLHKKKQSIWPSANSSSWC